LRIAKGTHEPYRAQKALPTGAHEHWESPVATAIHVVDEVTEAREECQVMLHILGEADACLKQKSSSIL
jgi:phosphoribosylformimino-5-aminoimidazole carboxamide ribonucleotide (ProFAR) isomerase